MSFRNSETQLQTPSSTVEKTVALEIGYTPEGLTNRVTRVLSSVGLVGVEGVFRSYTFSLKLDIDCGGFSLTSPSRKPVWEEDGLPDIFARVSIPNDVVPEGQIIWADKSTMWGKRDEISNGQKVSLVLDAILKPLENLTNNSTP